MEIEMRHPHYPTLIAPAPAFFRSPHPLRRNNKYATQKALPRGGARASGLERVAPSSSRQGG